MDPTLAALLSVLVTAISTAILRWSAYYWPANHHRKGAERNKEADEEQKPETD
jgi:hypothetical protein